MGADGITRSSGHPVVLCTPRSFLAPLRRRRMHPMLLLYAPPPRGRAHISSVFLSPCRRSPAGPAEHPPVSTHSPAVGSPPSKERSRLCAAWTWLDEGRRDSRLGCPLLPK